MSYLRPLVRLSPEPDFLVEFYSDMSPFLRY
jgi:hypothetical protein